MLHKFIWKLLPQNLNHYLLSQRTRNLLIWFFGRHFAFYSKFNRQNVRPIRKTCFPIIKRRPNPNCHQARWKKDTLAFVNINSKIQIKILHFVIVGKTKENKTKTWIFTGFATTGTPINLDPLLFSFARKIYEGNPWKETLKNHLELNNKHLNWRIQKSLEKQLLRFNFTFF